MIKYIKDSIRELKHVVWPTREETNGYFITVVIVLIAFGLYLFIASTVFTKGLFGLKDIVDNNSVENTIVLPETKVFSTEVEIPKIDSVEIKTEEKVEVEVKTETTK
ncbi:MAG: preprotein translocase subunit SecE [Candidatus Gracilibacteria bacterium]|nr:preprotein translocase subunit SecE [Candidatus Gracilibacteria bacterium]